MYVFVVGRWGEKTLFVSKNIWIHAAKAYRLSHITLYFIISLKGPLKCMFKVVKGRDSRSFKVCTINAYREGLALNRWQPEDMLFIFGG